MEALFGIAKCLPIEADLPKQLWLYALKTSAYIQNRSFSTRTIKAPFETLTGRPNFGIFYIFGETYYVYQRTENWMQEVKEECVGYGGKIPAYLVCIPERGETITDGCVTFCRTNMQT